MITLIKIPLGIMIIVSILSLLGMGTPGVPGTVVIGVGGVGGEAEEAVYYDNNGNPKCYVNGTAYDEPGRIVQAYFPGQPIATWQNATFQYMLYWDESAGDVVYWVDVGKSTPSSGGGSSGAIETAFNDSTLGLWAIVIGFAVFAGIVGLKVFGSGISEASVNLILIVAVYGALWGVFAVLSYPVISAMELIGAVVWFSLTVMYAVGVLSTIGNQNNGEGA